MVASGRLTAREGARQALCQQQDQRLQKIQLRKRLKARLAKHRRSARETPTNQDDRPGTTKIGRGGGIIRFF